jgi:tripartite-type tricarboxylate transporter receptor subunit TctC
VQVVRAFSIAAAAILAAAATGAAAQTSAPYPVKPVRFLVPYVAGGGTDTTARALAQKLSEAWGRQVIVDNRPGASGAIAIDLTAKAAPDGYTICIVTASHAVDAAVNPGLPYDFARDLSAVSQVSSISYLIYDLPSFPVRSVKELIAHAKANPGKVNYASGGSIQYLGWELLAHLTGVKLVQVPYKGGAAVVTAVLSGEVHLGMQSLITVRPHLATGRLRGIAVTTLKRSPVLPELPTVAESGVPGYELDQWYGVVAPARVPQAVIATMHQGIAAALRSPDVVQRMSADGSTAVGSSPEKFGAYLKSEVARWRKLVRDAGLVLNTGASR